MASDMRGAVELGARTPMARAHDNGMRRAKALLKNRLADPTAVDTAVGDVLKLYLREWSKIYDAGTRAEGIGQTERTMLFLRHDTLLQMAAELEKVPSGVEADPASSGDNPA